MKLAAVVTERINDSDYARELFLKAEAKEIGTPELLELANRVVATLGDQELARGVLRAAEDRVTNLDEMRKVAEAVKRHFADEAPWVAEVDEKLAKREANQAKYAPRLHSGRSCCWRGR